MARSPLIPCLLSVLAATRVAWAEPTPAKGKPASSDTVAGLLEDDAKTRGAALGVEATFDRVRLAYEVSGRAVHGLELARLLAKANDPIRALGVYRAVVTTPLGATPEPGELEAVATAKAELAQLLVVIPRVVLDVSPRSVSGLRLTIDAKPVGPGVPLAVRAGQHTVDASANGFESKRLTVDVAERDRKHVAVALESSDEEEEEAAPASAAQPATVLLPALHPAQQQARGGDSRSGPRGSGQRTLGWIFVGWGAVVLVGGGVATYLEHEHPGDKKDLLHTLSLVGFSAGGGLAILGLTVVLTAPAGNFSNQAAASSRFVPSMIAVHGAF